MLEAQLISIAVGIFIGLVMAITGAGGSILAVPILVFSLNLSIVQSAPIALLAVMIAAIASTVQGLYRKTVRYKAGALIGCFGILFAPIGVWVAKYAPNQILSLIFAAVLVYVALRMWNESTQNQNNDESKPPLACVLNPATSRLFWTAPCTKRLIATGSAAGLLSGLLGVGGGFVIVPSLRSVSNFDMQTVTATSLMAIALISMVTIASYSVNTDIDWGIAVPFISSTMLSMFVFRGFSHKISANVSQRGFALLTLVAATLLLIKLCY